jgi:hypothetical protein
MPPLELALSRPPPSLSLQALPRTEYVTLMKEKRAFMELVKTLRLRANGNLHKTQVRYKRNYDRGVQPNSANLREGDQAFLRVEFTDTRRNQKLESLVQGPLEVVEMAGTTFRLRIGDETGRVSSDRVTPAPVRENYISPKDRPT